MNQKTIIITIVLIALIAWLIMFLPRNSQNNNIEETPIENLNKSTQYEDTDEMDAILDSIDINASSSEDFENIDMDIQSI